MVNQTIPRINLNFLYWLVRNFIPSISQCVANAVLKSKIFFLPILPGIVSLAWVLDKIVPRRPITRGIFDFEFGTRGAAARRVEKEIGKSGQRDALPRSVRNPRDLPAAGLARTAAQRTGNDWNFGPHASGKGGSRLTRKLTKISRFALGACAPPPSPCPSHPLRNRCFPVQRPFRLFLSPL